MTVLIVCLFISLLLPILAKAPVAYAMNKLGGYDNRHPRAQQAQLTGFGARALAAHKNAFEAVIFFAPAVLVAIATNNTGSTIQTLAMSHIAARVIYNLLYVFDINVMRSVVWGVGYISSLAIVFLCIPG